MVMTEALSQKLARKRMELSKAENQVELLKAEIRAYEDALQLVGGLHPPKLPGVRKPRERRKRTISPGWAKILKDLGSQEYGYDEILKAGAKVGHPIARNVARSQMKLYADAGYVDRISEGLFKTTDDGIKTMELALAVGDVVTKSLDELF
jgi:hypothetical protein